MEDGSERSRENPTTGASHEREGTHEAAEQQHPKRRGDGSIRHPLEHEEWRGSGVCGDRHTD